MRGYQLLDWGHVNRGAGERLEQWGPYRLRRPDPRALGIRTRSEPEWDAVDARFLGEAGRGCWERVRDVPERWTVEHGGVTLIVKLAPYKHTGVFPEQAEHWRWMTRIAGDRRLEATRPPLAILNLFAYTGGATMALAQAGHKVTHVDASQPAIAWARENAAANGLAADAVRWIHDDAATFVRRELKRGRHYDAVLMDPPAFGHAPRGSSRSPSGDRGDVAVSARRAAGPRSREHRVRGSSIWRAEADLPALLADTIALLANPIFVLVNHYAADADPQALAELIGSAGRTLPSGHWQHGRLRLRAENGQRLDTGVYARWHRAA